MQYQVESTRVGLLVLVVIAAMVCHVSCSAGTVEPSILHSHQEHMAPVSCPDPENPCGNHTVPCNPAGNLGARVVTIVSFTLSAIILLLPFIRIKGLQPRVSEEDTLFYWSTVFGFVGFGLWTIYFMHCSYQPHGSVLYILLVNIFGSVVYLILCGGCQQDSKSRAWVSAGVFSLAFCFKLNNRHYAGWIGMTFSIPSNISWMASTTYYDAFNLWMFGATVVGSVNGFLWLFNPQLCLSLEYKINSYAIGVCRGVEAFFWCFRAIARSLWRLEGVVVNAPPGAGAPPAAGPGAPAPHALEIDVQEVQ